MECSINDCGIKQSKKTYCIKHYTRWLKHGDPNILLRERHGCKPQYLFDTWANIKQRTSNPTNWAYQYYGQRGIGLEDTWHKSFVAFRDYVLATLGERPEGMTLDRVDNSKGYIPGNIKWATRQEQAINQRPKSNNSSGYIGVAYTPRLNKWSAYIRHMNKEYYIGHFEEPTDAANAYDNFALQLRGEYAKTNF